MESSQASTSNRIEVTSRLELASECVAGDAYDRAAFHAVVASDPKLDRCQHRGQLLLQTFPALLGDLFRLLFKLRPVLVDRAKVRPAYQVNRYLLSRLFRHTGVQKLRGETLLDEEAAGAATAVVGSQLFCELATADLADENVLLRLEESMRESRSANIKTTRARLKPRRGGRTEGSRDGDGAGGKPLAYDLQQRLDMAESLRSYRSFERLLLLTDMLRERLTNNDPTRWESPEVYEIGVGAELSRLLPGELLGLRAPLLKKEFLRRLLERRLLTYAIRDRERRGPMAILVDASHSMAGDKELASKALAIALWQAAASRGQAVSVTIFGPRTSPIWQTAFQDLWPRGEEVADLAETFFGGGTDFERPVSRAVDRICQRPEGTGQLVLISDGLCQVSSAWLSHLLARKARRQIQIITALIDLDEHSDRSAISFSDRIVHWSELVGSGAK